MSGSVTSVIVEKWREARRIIDDAINRRLAELPEASIVEAAKYIAMGGKRLRGFLLVSLAESLGASVEEAVDAAVAVELVHASSLALDDIIDEDLTRRGVEAAWVRFGLKKTVMVSNILIPYAQRIVYQRYGVKALERTVEAWLDISRGEVLDAFIPAEKADSSLYIEMVRLKTGALFRLAAELGVIAAKRPDLLSYAGEFGETIGVMYQIADDIRDSRSSEKVAKEPSLQLFLKWAPTPEKAYRTIEQLRGKALSSLAKILPNPPLQLRELPRFIVEAMLSPLRQ